MSSKPTSRKRAATRLTAIEISSGEDDDYDGYNLSLETPSKRKSWETKEISGTATNSKSSGRCTSKILQTTSVETKPTSSSELWQIHELLAENENIDYRSARNIVQLFQDDNTIPFICRYRRDMFNNNITPEKLRDIQNTYTEILNVRKRAQTIIGQLEKDNILTKEIRKQILSAKNLEDLEFLYAPYKPANKGSLFERAKDLGLDKPAENILCVKAPPIRIEDFIKTSNENLNSKEKVIQGICHVISHVISKSTAVLEKLRALEKVHHILLKSTKSKSTSTKEKENSQNNDEFKYEHYFSFEMPVKYIKPHHILAINRGEKAKYLSVKIIIPDNFKSDIKYFVQNLYFPKGFGCPIRQQIFQQAFDECYLKKLEPHVVRHIRSQLNDWAKKESIHVFAKNLKQLLLMSPLKGEKILGIDPGFSNGCKLALISETADVLDTGVIYPHNKYNKSSDKSAKILIKMLLKHNCNVIAVGNGTACRETEFWLSNLFKNGYLDSNSPDVIRLIQNMRYTIVSEQGASIYSCSEIAKKEFPDMDINVISAVSIARRLNDPLSEYVKIEPRHIGVGMYQHDINEKQLNESLNGVVSECVSFVGVDLNTASLSLLQHIAGLTASKAESIIEHRAKNGPFKTRNDLLKVKSIGPKTFTQCAGFVRIQPFTPNGKIANALDCTWVHPESYDIAEKIIKMSKVSKDSIGQEAFIEGIKRFASTTSLDKLEKDFKIPKERITVVLEALQRHLCQDYRADIDKKPLFKQGITKITELNKGSIVTGAVKNITHFGAFVDIGVEKDGLIHTKNMCGTILNLGDRVEVSVLDVDAQRGRIQLKFESFSV